MVADKIRLTNATLITLAPEMVKLERLLAVVVVVDFRNRRMTEQRFVSGE